MNSKSRLEDGNTILQRAIYSRHEPPGSSTLEGIGPMEQKQTQTRTRYLIEPTKPLSDLFERRAQRRFFHLLFSVCDG